MRVIGDDTVVVAPRERLPLVCVRTGEPTDRVLVHEVYDSPPWSWGFYLFWLWGFVAQLMVSERYEVRVPTSRAASSRFVWPTEYRGSLWQVPYLRRSFYRFRSWPYR